MIFQIFKKELLDTLRDRRTLVTMLVIPILIFPDRILLVIQKINSDLRRQKVQTLLADLGVISTYLAQVKQVNTMKDM